MNNPRDRRLLLLSFLLHIAGLFFLSFSYGGSQIRKQFVAYGLHSRKMTNAYFHRMRAPRNGYQRYLDTRRAKDRAAQRKRAHVKKLAQRKKAAIKSKPKPKPAVKPKPKQANKPKSKPKPKEQPKKAVKQPEKKVEKKHEPEALEEEEGDLLEEEEILHFNLMGETDPRVVIYQQCIQVEVDRVWRPPLGVPKGTECEACFTIARDGSVKEFKIQKSSKVLIYDLSIVRIANEFKFDKCLWGKSFVVTFRQ